MTDNPRDATYKEQVSRYSRKKRADYESFVSREGAQADRKRRTLDRLDMSPENRAAARKDIERDYYRNTASGFNAMKRDTANAQTGRTTPHEVFSSLYGQRYSDIELPKERNFGRKRRAQ